METKKGDHYTCTSSPIAKELGYDKENLPSNVLDELFKKYFGYEVSTNPVTARLQREQVIAKDKRMRKKP